MDGGDRAGYKQISRNVDATLITSTMGNTTAPRPWAYFEVVSSKAAIALVSAAGVTGSSLITSGTSFSMGAIIGGGAKGITDMGLSTDSTGHAVMAYEMVLL